MPAQPQISEWGNPRGAIPASGWSLRPTRGTETSQYPEEEKTNVIPQVAASERGGAQTGRLKGRAGVVGPTIKLWKAGRRTSLERGAIEGDSPVTEIGLVIKAAPE